MPSGSPLLSHHCLTPAARTQAGFIYLALLLAVALLGLTAAHSLELGAAFMRREAEVQLLADGLALRAALRSYAHLPSGPGAPPGARGPRQLEELLRDPRVPGLRRHLRRIPVDPLTGRREWGLVRDAEGFITGIHSLAAGRPIRQAGFDPLLAGFENAASYREWVFRL